MSLTLTRRISPDTAADPQDTLILKRALNRLGFYVPLPETGITPYPDRTMIDAIRSFQAANGLSVTGRIGPDDDTLAKINAALARQPASADYVWRTRRDDRVRQAHAARDGLVFRWGDSPPGGHPGEDANCRCWAVPVTSADAGRRRCFTHPWWQAAKEHIIRFEGLRTFPYLDSEGYLSIGYGFNVNARTAFMALNLRTPTKDGRPATDAEKKAAYETMQRLRTEIAATPRPPNLAPDKRWNPFQRREADTYENTTNVRLPDTEADRILKERMDQTHREIKILFQEFSCFPAPAKVALFDMHYNLGAVRFSVVKWEKLFRAVDHRDWATAARESSRSGLLDRSEATRLLFHQAARIEDSGQDEEPVPPPKSVR